MLQFQLEILNIKVMRQRRLLFGRFRLRVAEFLCCTNQQLPMLFIKWAVDYFSLVALVVRFPVVIAESCISSPFLYFLHSIACDLVLGIWDCSILVKNIIAEHSFRSLQNCAAVRKEEMSRSFSVKNELSKRRPISVRVLDK